MSLRFSTKSLGLAIATCASQLMGQVAAADEGAPLKPLAIAEIEREQAVDFATEIYPVFKQNCIACHAVYRIDLGQP